MSTRITAASTVDDYFMSDAAVTVLLNSDWVFQLRSDEQDAPATEPQCNSKDAA